ncbi:MULTISPECIES: flavohemoglobin expression-modulating QEGLA motif protein [Sphingobacterium]|uniref:flavohemoglobin expression-modulating QEGLA motif protein n=1 Tax=Sphingobacterium TaxID=28453 RepID=UPI0013DBF35D|nr:MULTISPECIES: tyrosine/phenylalanine carboxypeptidase domain-containing protein [unclassified Sphingobacterium]
MSDERRLNFIWSAIKAKQPFHVQIPNIGKLVFSKIVPCIFIYRSPISAKDKMLSNLAKSQLASIIIQQNSADGVTLLRKIATSIQEQFGSCLLVEIWSGLPDQASDVAILVGQKGILPLAEYMHKNLQTEAQDIVSEIQKLKELPHPPGCERIFSLKESLEKSIYIIGMSIRKSYQLSNGEYLPILLRHYRESLGKILLRVFFEYVRLFTDQNPATFRFHLRKEITPNVFDIDKSLTTESQRFDFLLLVTPLNVPEAWESFKKSKFSKSPVFQYRPMPIDPDLVKRNLYNLRIEDIYDPTIAYLFRDKRRELDEMMSMLADRNTEDFMHGSLQVFGNVSDNLLQIAQSILTVIAHNSVPISREEERLNAKEFAQMAREEIAYLSSQAPDLHTTVRVRSDISGVMVNRGVLNIGADYQISPARAPALIQHEVGTHIATYFNGKAQPLQLFSLGVPGYEQLQEGLAVFAEYLIGGLSNQRLRILAGRVIAVRNMLMGHTFMDTFALLMEEHLFSDEMSFNITMRVYRGGGLTKDALYLQGLIELITYIKNGQDLKLLTVGKIREDYIPIIQDLIQRGYMNMPVITPRYLSGAYDEQLNFIKHEGSIFKLIQ